MLSTARKLSTRHYCAIRGMATMCTKGTGKPKRARCAGCGGALVTVTGLYGVFAWRGDGRYPESDAVKTFTRESAAEAFTTTDESYVVRWIALES